MKRRRPSDRAAFSIVPARLAGECDDRLKSAENGIRLHNPYLDDRLRMLLPHDLVIVTARSGAGKSQAAIAISADNALNGREVAFFALEAEPREFERRLKYQWLSVEAWSTKLPGVERLNYTDWLLGRCEDIVGDLNEKADEWMLKNLSTLWTYYKGAGDFDADQMAKEIAEVSPLVDLVVLDHLHYVDGKEGENENKSQAKIAKTLRDSALALGKPVIAVAHLRKRTGPVRTLLPEQDDIMGSSDVYKITTQIIAFAPARFIEPPKWWLAPTLIGVIKDRREGNDGLAALTYYDTRTRAYANHYTLGRLTKGDTEWEELKSSDVPRWAKRHRPLDGAHVVDNSPKKPAKSSGVDFSKRTKNADGSPIGPNQGSSDDAWRARMGDEPGNGGDQ